MGINREDKDKALEAALLQIHKQFGQGAIMKLGDEGSRLNIDSISTGSVSLDIATGIGGIPRGRIGKNKVAPPFKQAEFDIMYGFGSSREGDVLDCAVEAKLVEKAGSWYSFEGNRIGQGRENVKNYLIENPEILNRMSDLLKESFKPKTIIVDDDGVVLE